MNTNITRNPFSLLGTATVLSFPTPCRAATNSLPWDQTFLALQNMLVSTVAPTAIGLAFAGAVILYVLGEHDEQAGRLFGSGLGGCIALAIVHLLNYVAT